MKGKTTSKLWKCQTIMERVRTVLEYQYIKSISNHWTLQHSGSHIVWTIAFRFVHEETLELLGLVSKAIIDSCNCDQSKEIQAFSPELPVFTILSSFSHYKLWKQIFNININISFKKLSLWHFVDYHWSWKCFNVGFVFRNVWWRTTQNLTKHCIWW